MSGGLFPTSGNGFTDAANAIGGAASGIANAYNQFMGGPVELINNSTVALNGGGGVVKKEGYLVGSLVSLGDHQNSEEPFFFTEFEVPSELEFGVYQMGATHDHIGGGRTIDIYGAQEHSIEITGMLHNMSFVPDTIKTNHLSRPRHPVGATAMQRLGRLRQMCVAGAKMKFQHHQFEFTVVVMDATFVAYNWNEAKYTLKLSVLESDLTKGMTVTPQQSAKFNPPAQTALFYQFRKALKQVDAFNKKAALLLDMGALVIKAARKNPKGMLFAGAQMIPGSGVVFDVIDSSLLMTSSIANFTGAVWPQFAMDMQNGQPYSTLDNYAYKKYLIPGARAAREETVKVNQFMLDTYPKLEPADRKNPAFKKNYSLMSGAANEGRQLEGTLGQMEKTMQKIIVPKRGYTVTKLNPNLAKVALEVYGDATKWKAIADANGLTTIANPGLYVLFIPYRDQIEGGDGTLGAVPNGGT